MAAQGWIIEQPLGIPVFSSTGPGNKDWYIMLVSLTVVVGQTTFLTASYDPKMEVEMKSGVEQIHPSVFA